MTKPLSPSEIAREVLRQLALRRTLPTPDNYMALYHEIAGTKTTEVFPEKSIKELTACLPRGTAEQLRFVRQLEAAGNDKSWDALKTALQDFASSSAAEPPAWADLIRDLTQQLERSQSGLTSAKKRETIEHVIQASGSPNLLFSRLQSLLNSWATTASTDSHIALVESSAVTSTAAAAPAKSNATTKDKPEQLCGELRELIAQLLENSISALLIETPDLSTEAKLLAAEARAAHSQKAVTDFTVRMKKFSYRLHFLTEDQVELKTTLLHLLQLIIKNISELVVDDHLLHGQIDVVLGIFDKPLNLRHLDDIERRMKDVIYKQSILKKHLSDAQHRLKTMLATFVDRLGDFSASTTGYHDTIERCAKKISAASDIAQLSDVLDEVMHETRVIQLNAQRSRDELQEMRIRAEEAEQEIDRLQAELAQTSDMVRQDALTGVLNRKGLNEALEREVARVKRHASSLCLALLDIDNFKKLNDTHGHQVGDTALVHLATVIKETIRPQDTIARYGGEEFVILLPETGMEESIQVLTRLQRELTRKFFMSKNEKMLITFSAGVAEMLSTETPEDTLKRADEAMYLAKRAGKNRVMAA